MEMSSFSVIGCSLRAEWRCLLFPICLICIVTFVFSFKTLREAHLSALTQQLILQINQAEKWVEKKKIVDLKKFLFFKFQQHLQ